MKILLVLSLFVQVIIPDRVEIEPAEVTLEVGRAQTFTATAYTEDGTLELPIRWYMADSEIADVTSIGEVKARAPGQARLVAVMGGRPGYATIKVTLPSAASLQADLAVDQVLAGTFAPLRVSRIAANGAVENVEVARFRSGNSRIATVDRRGVVSGHEPGEAVITIRAGDLRTGLPVTVVPNPAVSYQIEQNRFIVRQGDVVRFRVRALDGSGQTVEGLLPLWEVTEGAAITAEQEFGVFVAEQSGTFIVEAHIGESITRSITINVDPRTFDARLETTGRGVIDHHHSGDMWVFEGVNGRDYAYVGTFMYDWMKVFDVTDPARPVLTDSVQVDARRINDVKINADSRIGIITREGASSRRNGIVLLDLSVPAHPSILSEYTETVTGGVHNVWIEGELVYACHNGTNDLHILDISNPLIPVEVGRWGLNKADKTLHDVIVQDGYAYLSYWDDGIVILDAGAGTYGGTPTEPALVSRRAYPIGHTHVAWRHGRYLFVGDEIWPDGYDVDKPLEASGYIHVFDVEDLRNPEEVARYEVPDAGAHNVWVEGDRLYVGYYQGGLRVVDISGELRGNLYEQGREIAVLRTIDTHTMVPDWPMAWGAQVHKGHIYTSDLNSGLWITRLVENPILP
ncbi:MAG: Ig-like domain-containing protein [Bacteroidota bacterium]|nr:Ig-like domain-containing protein [Bacteroidota bacterium]